jgi:hypothetical protein
MDAKEFVIMTVAHLVLFPVAWWVVTKSEALRRWMRGRLEL